MPPSPKPLRQRQRFVEDLYTYTMWFARIALPTSPLPAAAAAAGLLLQVFCC